MGTDDISEANIKNIFGFLDESEDKTVDFEEFKEVMIKITGNGWTKCDHKKEEGLKDAEIKALFDMIDKDHSGSLTKREAKKACKLIRDRFGIEDLEEWLNKVDVDHDGEVSYEEFKFSLAGNL